jgi:hypothetical protein
MHPIEPPTTERWSLRAPEPAMTASTPGLAQYLLLSEQHKQLPGSSFENHHHPAVVLDLATGPTVRVWGWWTDETDGHPALPCLLWAGELGWSATVVEPDVFDSQGYERAFWSHRIKLLDLALANALCPCRTLEQLELHLADESLGADSWAPGLRGALVWGVLQLGAARALHEGGAAPATGPWRADEVRGTVDEELVAHGLGPMSAKAGLAGAVSGPLGLAALMEAVAEVPRSRRRHLWSLPAWKPGLPGLHRVGHG